MIRLNLEMNQKLKSQALLRSTLPTEQPMYFYYLGGDRIRKEAMYGMLLDPNFAPLSSSNLENKSSF